MKKNTVLGVYDHEIDTYAKVDPSVEHSWGINSTSFHETVHIHLTQRTDYALFTNLLFRIGRFNNKLKKTANFLQKQMINTQECIAVFMEVIYHYVLHGKDSSMVVVQKLKVENPSYYNYFEPLLFLIEEYDDVDPKEKGKLGFALGCLALSVDVKLIMKNLLFSASSLKSFYAPYKDSTKRFFPDLRFIRLVEATREILEETKGLSLPSLDDILEKAGIRITEEDISYVPNYLKEIISGQEHSDKMLEILNSLKTMEVNDEDMSLRVHPTSLKVFKNKTVEKEELINHIADGSGIFTMAKPVPSPKDLYPVIYMDLLTRTNYGSLFKREEISHVLGQESNPLVLRLSDFNKLSSEQSDYFLKSLERPTYIYLDAPYVIFKDKINELLTEEAICRFIDYDSFYLLVIKMDPNKDIFILQPLMTYQYDYVIKDLKLGILKARLNDKPNSDFDEILFKSESDLLVYDIIVNSMMQVGGNGDLEELQERYMNMISR